MSDAWSDAVLTFSYIQPRPTQSMDTCVYSLYFILKLFCLSLCLQLYIYSHLYFERSGCELRSLTKHLNWSGQPISFFFQFYVRKIISLSLFIFYILVPNKYRHIMDISACQLATIKFASQFRKASISSPFCSFLFCV